MKNNIDELLGQVYEIKELLRLSFDHFDYKKTDEKLIEHCQLIRNIEGYSVLSTVIFDKVVQVEQTLSKLLKTL